MSLPNLPEVEVSEEQQTTIFTFLEDEIRRNLAARQNREDVWIKIEEYYELFELTEKKDFPFEGAAHLMIGLMPMYVERAKAKMIKTLWAPSDPFAVGTKRDELAPVIGPARKFVTWAANNELKMKDFMKTCATENAKLGNCVGKAIYTQRTETVWEYQPPVDEFTDGTWISLPDIVVDQPEAVPVKLADYLFPQEARSQEKMEWEAQRIRYSYNELEKLEAQGIYENVKDLKGHEKVHLTDYDDKTSNDERPYDMEEYEVWEVWFRYKLRENVPAVEMVWWIELDSQTVLRKVYNWMPGAMRPFVIGHYERRPHKVYSNGIGQMALATQIEVSTMHNQRLDAGTLANATTFKRKSDSIVPEHIRVRLGDTIPVDDQTDLEVLQLGAKFDSTLQEENHTIGLLEQRVGLRDFMSQDAQNSGQATAMLAMMAETTARFDDPLDNMREFMAGMMRKLWALYQKHYPPAKVQAVLGEEDAMILLAAWNLPTKAVVGGLTFQMTATTATTSKELERQNKLSLFGMVTNYYDRIFGYLVQASSPQLPEMARMALLRIVDGLTTFVEDILSEYELYYADEITIAINELRQVANGMESAPPAQIASGGAGVSPMGGAPPGPNGGQGQPNLIGSPTG